MLRAFITKEDSKLKLSYMTQNLAQQRWNQKEAWNKFEPRFKGDTHSRSRTAHQDLKKKNMQGNTELPRIQIEITKKSCYWISLKWPDMHECISTKK